MSPPSNESVSPSRSVKNQKDASTTKKDASATKKDTSYNQSNFTRQTNAVKDLFSIPKPVKKLFDKVPIITYPANGLPERSPGAKNTKNDGDARLPSLYIFCREGEEDEGKPSFNPGCLKWQTFLRLAGVNHKIVSSNNHASPTGVLPFLLPGIKSNSSQDDYLPIPSNGLIKYAKEQGKKIPEARSRKLEAYQALLDNNIRNAWLHTLYLTPSNFNTVATPLYINPTSSSLLVRLYSAYQLRAAAESELRKSAEIIDADLIYKEADRAWEALSLLLGGDEWFEGDRPGVFDAAVFAYTWLLGGGGLGWWEGDGGKGDRRLPDGVERWGNLVRHRERVFRRCWGEEDGVLV
ncbi:6ff8c967-3e58-425d-9619-6570839eab8d [Sclerotinia trifoliorum]|uniref:6ff8c967-3e58-425d-9619-6570839eab8d n=1 Tax=Sclerotinia trifoliorum TaxID=28548 RepID=A0A8H2VYY3_9HELO|nr:6ff8c967-3e58-425d-9619-6570839eab8d [Sclerotinia trifoliorum]